MSSFDWDSDRSHSFADDLIEHQIYEDIMGKEEFGPVFTGRSRRSHSSKTSEAKTLQPSTSAEEEKVDTELVYHDERADRRSKTIARVLAWFLVIVLVFAFANHKYGQYQMKKGLDALWNNPKGCDELEAAQHFKKAGILIKQRGAKALLNLCYAQRAYADEKEYIDAMMYAREIDYDTVRDVDLSSALAYQLLVDGLSKHFKVAEDYSVGLPYVGMPEDDLDLTCMGAADSYHGKKQMQIDGREVTVTAYNYYNTMDYLLFTAWCNGGKVVAIEDHTKSPFGIDPRSASWQSSTDINVPISTPTPSSGYYSGWKIRNSRDLYGASDYSNPDDFYDDHYDDFFDYDEAEEYWVEHEYD